MRWNTFQHKTLTNVNAVIEDVIADIPRFYIDDPCVLVSADYYDYVALHNELCERMGLSKWWEVGL